MGRAFNHVCHRLGYSGENTGSFINCGPISAAGKWSAFARIIEQLFLGYTEIRPGLGGLERGKGGIILPASEASCFDESFAGNRGDCTGKWWRGATHSDHGRQRSAAPLLVGQCSPTVATPFSFLSICTIFFAFLVSTTQGLGSMSTVAAPFSSGTTVCGILAGNHSVGCWNSTSNTVSSIASTRESFFGLAGGKGFFCGLRESSRQPFCWATSNTSRSTRLNKGSYTQIAVGESHVCGLRTIDGSVDCWRSNSYGQGGRHNASFSTLTAGANFTCGINSASETVCWGDTQILNLNGSRGQYQSINAGSRHVCGITKGEVDSVQCLGDNSFGQSSPPTGNYTALALGTSHSCGLRADNHEAQCWGDNSSAQLTVPSGIQFSAIAAADYYTCGIKMSDLSMVCWGKRFSDALQFPSSLQITPGNCTETSCPSGTYQFYGNSTRGVANVCKLDAQFVCLSCTVGCPTGYYQSESCGKEGDRQCSLLPSPAGSPQSYPPPKASSPPLAVSATPPSSDSPSPQLLLPSPSRSPQSAPAPKTLSPPPATLSATPPPSSSLSLRPKRWIVIIICVLGTVGGLIGLMSIAWCLCNRNQLKKVKVTWHLSCSYNSRSSGRVHHSAEIFYTQEGAAPANTPIRSVPRLQVTRSSNRSRREFLSRADIFSFNMLAAAAENFQERNRIGAGSFGIVYRGVLADGREVAIKRADKASSKKVEENESAFQTEIEFLSRVHHKHLVSLVGYCDEGDERLLVYEYIPNGTVYDHLHRERSTALSSWHIRIKIALQAARGIEYLHTYAVPPIIHRDIKSSNILLDSTWAARVSDFGLSLMGPSERSHLSLAAAGTLGYMDPEYYRLQHLTTKSDVYSFGVVLMELLTGKKAIHKRNTGPASVVDISVPPILGDEMLSILDTALQPPQGMEMEAVSIMAEVAEHCVRQEGKERPSMTEVIGRLEQAFNLSDENQKATIGRTSSVVEIEEIALDSKEPTMPSESHVEMI